MRLFFARLYEEWGEGVVDLAGDLCLMLTKSDVSRVLATSVLTPENKWAELDAGFLVQEDSESDFFSKGTVSLADYSKVFVQKLEISMGWIRVEAMGDTFFTAPDIDQAMWDFLKETRGTNE